MLATSAFTVALESGSAFETTGGGGVGEITFSGTARAATTVPRTRRPLRASARTTVVTRFGGASVVEAPWSPNATNAMTYSLKQKFITLFNPAQNREFLIIRHYTAPGAGFV